MEQDILFYSQGASFAEEILNHVKRCLVFFLLTVIGIVAYYVVPSTPIPQQECSIPGPRDDVAVSSNVGL